MGQRIRVFLVDDHAVVRRGLASYLDGEDDIDVVGQAGNGRRALDELAVLANTPAGLPEVVLMDLLMPDMDGITATAELIRRWPGLKVIAVTSFLEEEKVRAALDAGAAGYLLKDAEADDVADAVRTVAAGDVVLPPAVARTLVAARHRPPAAEESLTPREREVIGLVAAGHTNQQIATRLGVSERTARTHVSNILAKLGLSSRTQAALWAERNGLTTGSSATPVIARPQGPAPAGRAGDPRGAVPDSVIAQVAIATGEGVVICDEDLRYVWANPAACRIMGYPLEELVGRNFLINFPERMHASMVEAYRAQLAGQTGTFSGTLLRRDGSELDMTWTNMTFVHDGRRYGAAMFRGSTRAAAARDVVGLASAAEIAAAGGELIDVLTRLADSGRAHTRALTVALDLVDADLVIRRGGRSGAPAGFAEAQTAVSEAGGRIPFIDVWYSGRAVVLADARTRLRQDPAFVPLCDALDAGLDWQTAVYAAIASRGRVLGGLSAYFPAGIPSPTDAELTYLTALADYGALAIEHDRLRRAGEHAAALEERNRLARELHDSVSQALFSMTLHTRAAQKALDRSGEDGDEQRRQLAKAAADVAALRELTTSALADMRALIFELRPDAVVEHGLVDALTRQATPLALRNGLDIPVTGPPGRLPLSAEAEEQAYRIALEAVHNAVKHADARTIRIDVVDLDDAVAVTVTDDGRGFDPTAAHPGHLGLTSMRERAGQVGADLQISTGPGAGTTVRLTLPTSRADR